MDLETLAIAQQKTDDRSLRNEGRIRKLEESHDALNKLATSVAVMAERQDTMNSNVEKLTEKVDAIENKPAERWDKLITGILSAIAGAFVAWMLSGAAGL
jgi:predicted nuclease with TOPRIM domain